MAKKKRGQQQIKGFRPGKEPLHLKKQRAKAQLGSEATWSQKQAVEAVAGRTPEEVRRMIARWSLVLIVGALLLIGAGAFLYSWSIVAGVVVHALAAVLLFLAYRLRKQASGLVQMAGSLR